MELTDGTDRIVEPADKSAMVLLIDDQVMICEAIRRALAAEPDICLHYCTDAGRALDVAEELKPTVLLQDLIMPGIDGLTLLPRYRTSPVLRDVPILVLSTKEDPKVKSAAFEAGANDYLVKIPDAIELVARIRYHSRSYVALQQRDEAFRALRDSQRQLLAANLELERMMKSDGLTGLANRRHFDEYLEIEWRRAHRNHQDLSLLMLDVDFFKRYNDRYGHVAGDNVLREIAKVLKASCGRATDLAARYGGEEFAIVLPNTPADGAFGMAERVRQAVKALAIPHCAPQEGATVSISLGCATVRPTPNGTPTALIEAADQALYRAKEGGRDRVATAA
ncbi:diguanylate cyclase domain-containing protein [Marinibaculum pumilum]|uniref:diguanylate cyclase n=1 Tax=Marinibaculum pumilum TaxID=1766165 RepID=A0ABV7L960_9PROT